MRKYYWLISTSCILLLLGSITYFWIQNPAFQEKSKDFIGAYDFSKILLGFFILLASLLIEVFVLPYKQTSLFKILHPNESILTDVLVGLTYILGIASVFKGLLLLGWSSVFSFEGIVSSKPLSSVIILPFVFYLLLADFLKYWYHRISHEIEFLWQIHKFHHAATDFVIITGSRTHPLEKIFQRLVVFTPLNILGASMETYIGILILINFVEKFQHSSVNWNWGWIGRNIIFSPIGHRIHHSMEEEHWEKNYGDLFVFWDKIFGTYYFGENINKEVGVTDNWLNDKGVIYDLWHTVYLAAIAFKESLYIRNWKAIHLRKSKSSNKT